MNQVRKNYSREFKIEAVRLIEEEKYSLAEAAIRLGVSRSVLSKYMVIIVICVVQIMIRI